jgi:DNA polymerase-4
VSLDEAFLNVRGCERLFGTAPEIARKIKECVRPKTGLIASVGVAPNKFLAKLASDIGKPDGFVVLTPDKVTEFLSPLPVSRIWGVDRHRFHRPRPKPGPGRKGANRSWRQNRTWRKRVVRDSYG